jgi:hypothetical protein
MLEFTHNLFKKISDIIDGYREMSIQKIPGIALSVIFFCSNIHTNASITIKRLSDKYVVVNYLCNSYVYINNKIESTMHKLFARHKIEPEYSPWINVTWLNEDNDTVEEYFDFSKDENLCQEYMNSYFETTMSLATQKPNANSGVIIMRYENKTRCNIIAQNASQNIFDCSASSNVKFIAIEYKHPLMEDSIPIELDRSWFLCGNELLSDAFVRRWLDYQSTPVYYDESYIITLIDNNMNILKLDNTQWVVLEKDTYRIVKRDIDASDTESFESVPSDKIDSDDNSE